MIKKEQNQDANAKPTLTNLAAELEDMITGLLPLRDKLCLRATCKKLSTIQAFSKRLYLHPRRIADVINFCTGDSEFLVSSRNGIEELVILGKSSAFLQQRGNNGNPLVGGLTSFPWPHSDRAAFQSLTSSRREGLTAESELWEENYESLLLALGDQDKLPRLDRLLYLDDADEDGYCAVPQHVMESHIEKSRPGRDLRIVGMQWTDTEMLCGIIANVQRSFASLLIKQPTPDVRYPSGALPTPDQGLLDLRQVRPAKTISDNMKSVSHMTLTAPSGSYKLWHRLLSPATQLRSLTIDHKAPIDQRWKAHIDGVQPLHERVITCRTDDSGYGRRRNFLCDFPICTQLEELNIQGHTESPNRHWTWHIIPLLARLKSTLKIARFQNVFFCDSDRVEQDMKDVLQAMKKCDLKKDELTVPCLDLDEASRATSKLGEIELAKRYQNGLGNWFGREVFDGLAAELGIELRNGWWDFAEKLVGPSAGDQVRFHGLYSQVS